MQQYLVALAVTAELARETAEREGSGSAPLLAELSEQVQAAIDELRLLAHGIYPLVLASSGLARALPAVADKTWPTGPVLSAAP